MVNAPTKREMNAKTNSPVWKKDSAWSIELVCSPATVCPVTTSTPGGSTAAIDRSTVALSAPGCVRTFDGVVPSDQIEQALRGGQIECGERGSGEVVGRPERDQTGDGERLRRSL